MRTETRPGTRIRPGRQLALATWVSFVNFWAWNLVGSMAIAEETQESPHSIRGPLLVAAPILVGALGRIVVGPLTDRFGPRTMFVAVSLAAIGPVLAVGSAELLGSLPLEFTLGVAGTVFAVGIPFAHNWYSPDRRGFAMGVFGMGMAGTAVSAFFTPRFVHWFGLFHAHLIVAVALAATAALCAAVMHNGPYFEPNTAPLMADLKVAARLWVTWEMALLYAVVFGGFIAFSNYLPVYMQNIYGFSPIAAGSWTAVFALAAVLARPVGGGLADRIAPSYVIVASLAGVAAFVLVAVFQPPPAVWSAATFITLAAALGMGTGGVFAWVSSRAPAGSLGAVTGIVSAIGGLGGYFPPLVMGATYDPVHHNYTVGLLLLVATALAACGYAAVRLRAHSTVAECSEMPGSD